MYLMTETDLEYDDNFYHWKGDGGFPVALAHDPIEAAKLFLSVGLKWYKERAVTDFPEYAYEEPVYLWGRALVSKYPWLNDVHSASAPPSLSDSQAAEFLSDKPWRFHSFWKFTDSTTCLQLPPGDALFENLRFIAKGVV